MEFKKWLIEVGDSNNDPKPQPILWLISKTAGGVPTFGKDLPPTGWSKQKKRRGRKDSSPPNVDI